MANPFVHIELHTGDLARAKAFYSQLFDWKLRDIPMPGGGTYTMISVGEGTGGGMMSNPAPSVPPHWLAYIGVGNVMAATEKARSLGATIRQNVMEVGEYGWMSVITDPTGATFALWEAKISGGD